VVARFIPGSYLGHSGKQMFVASRSQADPKLRFTTTLADGRVGWKTVVDRPTFEGAADVELQTRRFGDSQMRPDNRGVSCQAMSRLFDKGTIKIEPGGSPSRLTKRIVLA
jgi:hypothetical protein